MHRAVNQIIVRTQGPLRVLQLCRWR
jgi:hypothetical protein